MMQWVTETLQSASMGPVALPLAFLLGLVSAVASACCTLPDMGMLLAYSGTRKDMNRRTAFASAISFMIGTTLALIVLGFVAGFVGQSAQTLLGRYWKLFAGSIAIVLGLAALKMLPFNLPQFTPKAEAPYDVRGMLGTVVVGLLMGGGVAACSLPCNPGIFIVLGAAVLQGHTVWGMVLMAWFALGFSLPLSAILLGGSRQSKFKRQRPLFESSQGFCSCVRVSICWRNSKKDNCMTRKEKPAIKLQVFDPVMCCSSSLCGSNVDDKLVQFSAALEWLRAQGVLVERYNPSHQYDAFTSNALVVRTVNDCGIGCLPLILGNEKIVSHSVYPGKDELAALIGLGSEATVYK